MNSGNYDSKLKYSSGILHDISPKHEIAARQDRRLSVRFNNDIFDGITNQKDKILLKSLLLGTTFILIMCASAMVWANYYRPLLVLDMRNSPELPKHFRTTSNVLPQSVNPTGLAELHAAGSGQFSALAFKLARERMQTDKLLVIDLRQESHGMLNGNAVSWYGPRDAANAGKSPEQIETRQSQLLITLGEDEIALVNQIVKKSDEGEIEKVKPIEFLVHQTSTEQEFLSGMGVRYQRIYVQDFHAPAADQVDRFISIVNELPKDEWIFFHCRGGVGRTTVFMAMYDMMRNAKKVSFADIMARQTALGGKDLTRLPNKKNFKYKWAVNRLKFLQQFYAYSRTNTDNFQTLWTEWKQITKST